MNCPIDKNIPETSCPVQHDGTKLQLEYNPSTNDFKFDQSFDPSQQSALSTVRAVSSIPKADQISPPKHQPNGVDRWVYPSEQQYFNAMKRKGHNPSESEVPVILAIHNIVNEQGWSQIKEWEYLSGNTAPRLVRFCGRPKDLSPKALMLSFMG